MFNLDDITVIIVNYRTLDLTSLCVESLLEFYPTVKLLLIDNGSGDTSSEYIQRIADKHPGIRCQINLNNRYHGPALDQGLHACRSRLALILDSDIIMNKAGLLEGMTSVIEDAEIYAVGRCVDMDWFGYETEAQLPLTFPYIHPACMLLRRDIYLKLKPFIHHGSPGIRNMRQAWRAGYELVDFSIQEYLTHEGRGTCSRYGYSLGVKHNIEFLLHNALCRLYSAG